MQDTDCADWIAVVDALYRFAAGQDRRDEALFASAFTADAELDFTQPARALSVDIPVFVGRDSVVATVMAATAGLDTAHTVTNPRVRITGGTARLEALVEALHLPAADHGRRLALKNCYSAELARGEGDWRIRRLRIDNIAWEGDPGVLFPAAG